MYKSRSQYIMRSGYKVRLTGEALRKQKKEYFIKKASKIKVGKVISGKVVNFNKFGAVVDISGVWGFLHISEISDKWLNHPSEVLNINDILRLKVISNKIDKKGRVSIKLSNKFKPFKKKNAKKRAHGVS